MSGLVFRIQGLAFKSYLLKEHEMIAFRSITVIALSSCAAVAYGATDSIAAGTECRPIWRALEFRCSWLAFDWHR